ncbi:MAG: DUF4292 domain-containing protein [Bacteroidetes bacterium]|nr:DUF4292 domain-containing protein [Bacteroidota bacterium]MBS1631645.1 DUF4292 domain-containing protein [Bacteroidota bacterium]
MNKTLFFVGIVVSLFVACRSTKKIQTAISKTKTDTAATVVVVVSPERDAHADSLNFIRETYDAIEKQKIHFTTFSAKVNVDYMGGNDKNYNVNAYIRMYNDSLIWISVNAFLGMEAMRVLITKDSVKLLNKQNKTYSARSVAYLQEVTALPLDLISLQQIIIGNPVFLDSNIVTYTRTNNTVSLLCIGEWFKNLITVNVSNNILQHSKLDDVDVNKNRTCDLTYSDYEDKKGSNFSTSRKITVSEKSKLDVRLNFRQYDFNETLSFPFPVPDRYKRN